MSIFTQFTNALAPYYKMTVVDTINALSSNKWNAVKQVGLYVTATALSMIRTQFFRDLFNNRLPTGDIKPNGEKGTWSQCALNAGIDGVFNSFPLGSYWYKTLTSGRMSAGSYRNNDNPFTYPISRFKSSWHYFNGNSWRGPKPIKGGINFLEGFSTLEAVPAPTSGIKMIYNLLDLEQDY